MDEKIAWNFALLGIDIDTDIHIDIEIRGIHKKQVELDPLQYCNPGPGCPYLDSRPVPGSSQICETGWAGTVFYPFNPNYITCAGLGTMYTSI
jgi:hypothetical protein